MHFGEKMDKHKIIEVRPGSIADELNIEPGDSLLLINGNKIADVLDYRFMIQDEYLIVEIEKSDGEIWELEIEKDEMEDLGFIFESSLMDNQRACTNHCIFCFIDQMPKELRPSLYFKDDDPRLSFLTGNYVTLTNLSQAEAQRIARYHLSPLHISVHAADPVLRCKMMGNPKAGKLFEHLKLFHSAGITMHFQIVLVKGVNDGQALDDTISALQKLGSSLSVVPVGLTKHRVGLYPIEPFTKEEAAEVIKQVSKWKGFAYCSDEWYIKAGIKMPDYEYYNDFPQLENGVGMWALFEREFKGFPKNSGIVTGEAAQDLMRKLAPESKVYVVKNDFFGENVTVSGLLTGRDIVVQVGKMAKEDGCKVVFLPENMFRAGTECTLDDMTREEIERELGVRVSINLCSKR